MSNKTNISYTCECGKIFTKAASFNGHKSNCKIHHIAKYGDLSVYENKQAAFQSGAAVARSHMLSLRSEQKIAKQKAQEDDWTSKPRYCERCNSLMLEKFGSGRFCSRSCANSGHDQKSSLTRSESAHKAGKLIGEQKHKETLTNYYKNPSRCDICNTPLPWERRNRKTCSKECYSAKRANIRFDTMSKISINHGNLHNHRFGFYKGIECDSSWELAFLLYHLDIGSQIKRNSDKFLYEFDGKVRSYYPDFIIDNVYYEIKGYKDDAYFEKVNQFPKDQVLVVIDKDLISFYLHYAATHYGDDFTYLYDKDRRSWFNHNVC